MIFLDEELQDELAAATAPVERSERVPGLRTLSTFLETAQKAVKLRGQVTVMLTTDAAIRRLNRQFRGKNKATDVLSFPSEASMPGLPKALQLAGDLAISVPTARKQAAEQGHALGVELKVLMLHGLLHLAGMDHETDQGQMASRELKLRALLKLPAGLIERVELSAAKPKKASAKATAKAKTVAAAKPAARTKPAAKPAAKPKPAPKTVQKPVHRVKKSTATKAVKTR